MALPPVVREHVLASMSLGIWPCGLWTLAVWRCFICAASRSGSGIPGPGGPVPTPPIPQVPQCPRLSGAWIICEFIINPGLRATAASIAERWVGPWIRGGWLGIGGSPLGAEPPLPDQPPVPDRDFAAGGHRLRGLFDIKVEARRVAGTSVRTRGWTGRSPS